MTAINGVLLPFGVGGSNLPYRSALPWQIIVRFIYISITIKTIRTFTIYLLHIILRLKERTRSQRELPSDRYPLSYKGRGARDTQGKVSTALPRTKSHRQIATGIHCLLTQDTEPIDIQRQVVTVLPRTQDQREFLATGVHCPTQDTEPIDTQ